MLRTYFYVCQIIVVFMIFLFLRMCPFCFLIHAYYIYTVSQKPVPVLFFE